METPPSPTIEYLGIGAELVQFTINPKARHYEVHGSGQILEYPK